MSRLLTWIAAHPFWVLLAVAGVTLTSFAGIYDRQTGELRLMLDPSAAGLAAEGDEAQLFFEKTRKIFGTDDGIIVVLESDDVFTQESLARVARLSKRLAALDGVSRVVSLSTVNHIQAVEGDVEIGPFFDEAPSDAAELERIRSAVVGNPLFHGSLVSTDGSATGLMVYFERLSDRDFLARGLAAQIETIADQEAGDAKLFISGRLHLQAAVSKSLVGDLAFAIPLIFLAAALVLLFAFRSLVAVVIPLLTIAVSVAWTLGGIAWLGRPLNLVTVIVPPLIVTLGFAYTMHVVSEYYAVRRKRAGEPDCSAGDVVAEALTDVSLPFLLTGLTTGLGFLALVVSPMAAIREFGVFAVLGVTCTLVASLTLTPALLALRPLARTGSQPPKPGWVEHFAERVAVFDYTNRRMILAGGVGVLLIALFGMTQIQIGASHIENFQPDAPVRLDYEAINSKFDGANPFQIVVEAGARDAFAEPANLRKLAALQRWLEAQPEIGRTASVVDYLMLLNRALHDDDPDYMVIPESRRLAQQLLFFAASEELDHFIDPRFQAVSISLRARVNDSARTGELLERIETRLAELPEHLKATATGDIVLLNRSLDAIARSQVRSISLAIVTIYLVLAAMFTSLRIGLIALFPNVLPIAIFFGVLGLFGVQLNASTSLIACIALGIAVDDTIHYFARFNSEARRSADESFAVSSALRSVAGPVTYTSLGLVLGFLALTTSELQNQVNFGLLSALTLAAAWLIDVTLTPALCSQLRLVTLWDVLTLDLGEDPHRSIPLFDGMSLRQARIVALMFGVAEVAAGTRVLQEGGEDRELYVVIEGQLEASVERDGRDVPIGTMGRGDTAGEVALFAGRRSASVDALTDARLLRLTHDELEPLQRRYPRIAAQLLLNLSGTLAERLVRTTARVG